jgi:hypothetical protein
MRPCHIPHVTIPAMSRPTRRRLLVLPLVALFVGACGSTPPSASPSASPTASPTVSPTANPTPSQDAAAVYGAINGQVQAIRGLDERKPIVAKTISREELADVLQQSFARDYPPERMAADEILYKALGLIPADAKLGEVYLDLLESQVAGLYDPTTESLYVVSEEGGVGPIERFFYSHEYDHALQDQHFDLEKFQKEGEGNGDRLMARQSLVEGDAYLTMTLWLQAHMEPAEVGEILAQANDPKVQAALGKIPPIVQAQILFAATQGTFFAIAEHGQGGFAAIDAAFTDPPESTEQIIHPDKWTAREAPVAVDLPDDLAAKMGKDWTVGLEDTWGEHQLGIWLGGTAQAAAAGGWGGDRITLLQGAAGAWAVAWRTAWDSEAEAAEFETAAETALGKTDGKGSVLPGEGGTTRWVVIGIDDAVLGKLAGVLGLAG